MQVFFEGIKKTLFTKCKLETVSVIEKKKGKLGKQEGRMEELKKERQPQRLKNN